MFFSLAALAALPELGERTREAMGRLLPGGSRCCWPTPRAFSAGLWGDPGTLGLRVADVALLAGVDGRCSSRAPTGRRAGGEAAGRRPGTAPGGRRSGDRRRRAARDGVDRGRPAPLRGRRELERGAPGAVPRTCWARRSTGQFHFDPATYGTMIREDIPRYDRFQDELVVASGEGARRILELGTGTGETARRLLARHPEAYLVGRRLERGDARGGGGGAARRAGGAAGRRGSRTRCPRARSTSWPARSASTTWTAPRRPTCSGGCAPCSARGRFVLADVVVPVDPPMRGRADARVRSAEPAGRAARVVRRRRASRRGSRGQPETSRWSPRTRPG